MLTGQMPQMRAVIAAILAVNGAPSQGNSRSAGFGHVASGRPHTGHVFAQVDGDFWRGLRFGSTGRSGSCALHRPVVVGWLHGSAEAANLSGPSHQRRLRPRQRLKKGAIRAADGRAAGK